VEDSRLDCKVDMVHCGLLGLLVVEESSWSQGRSESRRDVLSKYVDYRTGCSSRWSRQNHLHLIRAQYTSSGNFGMETHVVSRAPSLLSFDLDVWLLREQLGQQHPQPLLSLLPIERDSCFDSGSDYRVCDHPKKMRSLVAVCRGIGARDRHRLDHHRTLLKQVHLLCFHAYYGCAQ
jgi:hypothetical protein